MHNNVVNAFTPEANIEVAIVLVLASLTFFLTRMSLLFRTTKLLHNDKAKFKFIWDALLREPSAHAELARLQTLAENAQERCAGMVARQFNLSSISRATRPFAAFTPAPSAVGGSPVNQAARERRLSMLDPGPRRLSVIAGSRDAPRIIPGWPNTRSVNDAVRVFTQTTTSCLHADVSGSEPDMRCLTSSAYEANFPPGSGVGRIESAFPAGNGITRSESAFPAGNVIARSESAFPAGSGITRSESAFPAGSGITRSASAFPAGNGITRSASAFPARSGITRSESTGSTSSWVAWAVSSKARKTMKLTRAWLRGRPSTPDDVKDTLVHNLVTCELPNSDQTQPRLYRADSRALRFERLLTKLSSRDVCPLTIDESSPVSSLDQLHAQSCLLHGVLLDKATCLAGLFGGMFARKDRPGSFVRWEGEESRAMCKFADVKSVSRCIDKIDIAYGGDVSRLLDMCRQMIVFESISDMCDCLAALMADSTIEIVRIKNRMTASMDNADPLFAGYRWVVSFVFFFFLRGGRRAVGGLGAG